MSSSARRTIALIQQTSQNGESVNNGALCGSGTSQQSDFVRIRQRISRTAAEVSYDIVTWICGLLAAAWVTRDVSTLAITLHLVLRAAGAVCVLPLLSGLLAGLYRSRHRRGSLDEVVSVCEAALLTCTLLAALTTFLVSGQHAPLATVAGGAVFAVLAMLGARYILFAARQRIRRPTSVAAVKIIVFGADRKSVV